MTVVDDSERHSLAGPGLIALLIVLAGAAVMKQLPFTSSRPGIADRVTSSVESQQDVEARLWQDPFGAVDQYRRDARDRRRHRSNAESPRDGVHGPADFARSIPNAPRITVMPILVPGGPYAEDAEHRRRARYAALAAIHTPANGLMSIDDRHIGYVVVGPKGSPQAVGCEPQVVPCELQVVPYEWIAAVSRHDAGEEPDEALVILWIDESRLRRERPLESVLSLVERLHLCPRHADRKLRAVDVKIIGPQSTPVLKRMQSEIKRSRTQIAGGAARRPSCFEMVEMYTLATGADLDELNGVALSRNGVGAGPSVAALRVISRDDQLVPALVRELELRGVSPGIDHIVLLSELDSSYARELSDMMERQLCLPPGRCPGEPVRTVHRFGYFRGLDGVLPKTAQEPRDDGRTRVDRDDHDRRAADTGQLERADGDSQFDYLRRLAAEIREDTGGVYTGARRVKAIGIFGRDVYDKLLILQALREEYPRAIFFTTDLDARLVHPRDFGHARNLVVASGFGLRPDKSRHGGMPPFRDSYQTATFLAVRIALEKEEWLWETDLGAQRMLDRVAPPRLFEIGRTAAVDLSEDSGDDKAPLFHPRPNAAPEIAGVAVDLRSTGWAAGTVASLLVLTYLSSLRVRVRVKNSLHRWRRIRPGLRNGEGRKVILIGGAALPVTLLAGWLAYRSWVPSAALEPFAWFEGVSMWPTQLVRLAAVICSVCLLLRVRRKMARMSSRLTERFFAATNEEGARRDGNFPAGLPPRPGIWAAPWRFFKRAFGVKMESLDAKGDTGVVAVVLWRQYLYRASGSRRTARVLALALAYVALASTIIRMFGPPHMPFRGTGIAHIDFTLLWAAILLVSVLIFSVADAVWLCCRSTRELGRAGHTVWPPEVLAKTRKELGVPIRYLPEWIDLQFIAEWTRDLMPMIYYPALVIFLMIAARSTAFDGWEAAPIGLVIVFVLSLAYAATCAYALRRMAERVRDQSREGLWQHLLRLRRRPDAKGRAKQIEQLIAEVERMQTGAFAPLSQQTFVRAALLPLSGAGGLVLLQYFALGH